MQGHDTTSYHSSMGAYYDNETLEEILKTQRNTFPNGPLGALMSMKVELVNDRDPEALALFDKYMAGGLGTMEYASLIESIRIKLLSKPEINTLMV